LVIKSSVQQLCRGELCALRWSDIDPEHATLRVSRSLATRGGHRWEGDTKTHQHRDVALDPATLALLAERRVHQEQYAKQIGTKLVADAYVLSSHADGSHPCLPDSLGRTYWRLARAIGVFARFHDLRHFAATQVIAGGITLRGYPHVLAEHDRAAAELLRGLVLGPARDPSSPRAQVLRADYPAETASAR
jgi:integrase